MLDLFKIQNKILNNFNTLLTTSDLLPRGQFQNSNPLGMIGIYFIPISIMPC